MTEATTERAVDLTIGVDPDPSPAAEPPRAGPQGGAPSDRPSRAGGRRRPPARLQIMGWVMSLMFSLLVIVNLATRQELVNDVEDGVRDALAQEAEEFVGVAAGGINRSTEQPYSDMEELLSSHLQRQFPDDDEVMVGVLPDGRVLRQVRREPISLADRPDLVRAIVADASDVGSASTSDGELRWRKVLVREGGPESEAGTFIIGYAIDRDRTDVTETMRALVAVSLIGLVLAGAGAYLVSGRILAPVRLVRQTAAEITEQDLTRRIPVRGNDDISSLAEQFNAMLDRLSAAFSTQRRFVDDASHELRTPITIVRGHLELMGDDPTERAAVKRLVTGELDRMSRIVNDLLVLANSPRPDFVRLETVSLAELTIDMHAKVMALGDRRWLLDGFGEGDVQLDPQRITQAMVALAHNAVQHTVPHAEIRLGSSLRPGRNGRQSVSFWITDTGPGVRPEDAATIFDRFARGPRVPGGHRSGAGLGLAIVRAIAEAHHGVVRLISEPGRGASFRLELPTAHPADRRRR